MPEDHPIVEQRLILDLSKQETVMSPSEIIDFIQGDPACHPAPVEEEQFRVRA